MVESSATSMRCIDEGHFERRERGCNFSPDMRISSSATVKRTDMTHLRPGKVAIVAASLMLAPLSSVAANETTGAAELIGKLGIEEFSTPVKERAGWREPKKIVVLGAVPANIRAAFTDAAGQARIVEVPNVAAAAQAIADADIIVGLTGTPGICDSKILDSAKDLRWIHSISIGIEECMAQPAVKARNLLVTNMRRVDSGVIAEHAIALTLALARGLHTSVANKSQASWDRGGALTSMQTLDGKTMLVVGLGGIGSAVAQKAHGLGMKVVATRASGRAGPAFVSYVGKPDELLTLAANADVIVNTAPLTTETTGIFNAKFFGVLRPNALFVNVARGGSVVTEDLLKALNDRRIAGAGLDVVEPEPLPPAHPLWKAPNIIISPHVSSGSDSPLADRWTLAAENLRRYVAGERMLSVVDLDRQY
jgi:phosphoglycerate dehydrogenase-like enzyme